MPPPSRGRGRGARGGYVYPPDYYGYEDYYSYYGYDYHNYRGGYDDPYYVYDDFQGTGRGRGGRGGLRGAASQNKGRGAAPPRGRLGFSQRGGPGTSSRGKSKRKFLLFLNAAHLTDGSHSVDYCFCFCFFLKVDSFSNQSLLSLAAGKRGRGRS